MTDVPDAVAAEARATPPAVIHLPDQSQRTAKKYRSGSNKRRRQAGVYVRLLPEHLAQLTAAASAVRMSVPAYLISGRLNDDAVPRRHRRRASVDEAALMRALVAFNRASNNLNQIGRAGNRLATLTHDTGTLVDDVRELCGALDLLRDQFAAPIAAILEALQHDREG